MDPRKYALVVLILFMILPSAGCRQPAAALPDGEYKRIGFELDLNKGTYMLSSFYSSRFQLLEVGDYTLEGDQITFHARTMSPAQQYSCGDPTPYSYHWAFDPTARQLTLKVASESCQPRQRALTRRPMLQSDFPR
ncbi:MAG TPA: hypothetical protein VF823_12355 [Anaerolineales bacterium]